MGALFARVKTWVSTEDVSYSDLNAEFDNILNNLTAANVDDFSANASQMQTTADPGEVGTESLATSVAGEISRLRHLIREITGEDEWYETPVSSLLGLSNAIGTGLTANRLVSGRKRSDVSAALSAQPVFLVPNGAARTVKLDGTPVNFIYYVNGTEYTISSDVTLTSLTAAPSSNNTCLVNDTIAADQYWTKYAGEDGSEIPVDTMGSEISALVGKYAGFKLNNGSSDEYFIAYVKSTTSLTKARRGFFFDSTDAAIPRIVYSNNDTITLMKLTWVFAKSDGTLTATYNPPTWSKDEPSSPALGDYWFDLDNNTWKVRSVSTFDSAGAVLVGVCLQDTTNTVAARSFEFFNAYDSLNTMELFAESNSQVKSRFPGSAINVNGATIKGEYNLRTWDMTLDLESGVTESASTYYYFYLSEDGDQIISDKKPHDRREDLQGFYHPHQSYRCVGWAFNNASSNLEQVESYYRAREASVIRSVIATDQGVKRDKVNNLSGATFTSYLPDAALCRGEEYVYVHSGTSLSQVYTLDGFASQTINGSTTVALYTNGETLKIISDGSNWLIVDHYCSTKWTAYTPTGAWVANSPVYTGFWKRVGDTMEVMCQVVLGGAPTSTQLTFTIPSGPTIDTAKLVNTGTALFLVGSGGNIYDSSSGVRYPTAFAYYSDTTTVLMGFESVSGANPIYSSLNASQPVTFAINDAVSIVFRVPITGWLP